ncbi:hypothetical protein EDC04DRAFT_2614984 [Pisolithus marmoratus]|nr:hypothetical protein EDC04DRAFT_2614984 [Pisolithus marmoratus]
MPALLTLLHTLLSMPPPHLSACATFLIPTSTEQLITMARTKQTARKVTGHHAPRVNIEVLQKKRTKASLAYKKPSPKMQPNTNSFCVMCRDGESVEELKESHVKFKCVTCHWQKTKGEPQPYFVATLPTALVHLHLDTLEISHSQVNMLHSFLKAYFPDSGYHFSQLTFNLATPKSMDIYQKAASKLADTLSPYSRILLFLTTHSDEDRGDLFAGYNINNEPVASKFLQLLLNPLSEIITSANMVFYVCGSVVTKEKSFKGLKKAAQLSPFLTFSNFKPRSMLLFDAAHLQLAATIPYLHSLLDNTIIQGYPVSSAAQVALHDCGMLGRHSNVILILWESKGLVVQKFIWTDEHIKPGVTTCQFNVLNVKPSKSGQRGLQARLFPMSANILTVEKTWGLKESTTHP